MKHDDCTAAPADAAAGEGSARDPTACVQEASRSGVLVVADGPGVQTGAAATDVARRGSGARGQVRSGGSGGPGPAGVHAPARDAVQRTHGELGAQASGVHTRRDQNSRAELRPTVSSGRHVPIRGRAENAPHVDHTGVLPRLAGRRLGHREFPGHRTDGMANRARPCSGPGRDPMLASQGGKAARRQGGKVPGRVAHTLSHGPCPIEQAGDGAAAACAAAVSRRPAETRM